MDLRTELIEGHKGVVVAIMPFDPGDAWRQAPVRLAGRRHGWLVAGALNGTRFDGYIGERWGRFFLIIDEALRRIVGVEVGDTITLVVEPTNDTGVLARAIEQSKVTTQPSKPRADAVVTPAPTRKRAAKSRAK